MNRMLVLCVAMMTVMAAGVAAQQDEDKDKDKVQDHEKNAVRMVRLLNNAELSYALTYKDEGFACTLKQLGPAAPGGGTATAAGFISAELASGKSEEYSFRLNCAEGEKPFIRVTIAAIAEDAKEGARAFCSDMYVSMGKVTGGVINASQDGKAETCLMKGAPLR
jgi:hypothetical protein